MAVTPANHKKISPWVKGISWISFGVLAAASVYLMAELVGIQIFDIKQLVIFAVILILVAALMSLGVIFNKTHTAWRWICVILCLCMSGVFCLGGYYVNQTSLMLESVGVSARPHSSDEDENSELLEQTDLLTQKMAIPVTTYAMAETGIAKPSDLKDALVGTVYSMDEYGTDGAISQLKEHGATFETTEFANQYALVDALYAGSVDAIILPEQYHEDLLNAANDYNAYNALTTFTNTVDQYIYYTEIPDDMLSQPDPVDNIQEDPFVVLVSGSDSYGTLAVKSRSDVNMLVAVNPKTHQVLLVSIPRDAYVEVSCKKDETACAPVLGAMDKLTHTGLYGIGTTESTLEDFIGTTINYNVRINFSSLINIVDAIGGIDVEVEEGLEVERFHANGTVGVTAGTNHLEGERALAFARERYAYKDGDNQRVRNQQIVMKAIMKKMMSPAMLTKYPAFLRALSTAFATNMPSDQVRDLIRLEVSQFPDWNIQSYSLSGDSTKAYCAALGNTASVTLIPNAQLEEASRLIQEVKDGKTDLEIPDNSTLDSSVTLQDGSSSSGYQTSSSTDYDWYEEEVQIPVYDYSTNQNHTDTNSSWQSQPETNDSTDVSTDTDLPSWDHDDVVPDTSGDSSYEGGTPDEYSQDG